MKRSWLLFGILFFCFLFTILSSVAANPIPVYPDPQPEFELSFAFSDVQDGGFVIWLILVSFLDFAANLLFIYAGFFVLIKFNFESTEWFTTISRLRLISSVFLLSFTGIISEWVLGSWLGSFVFVAGLVFVLVFFLGSCVFNLKLSSTFFLSAFMVFVNIVSWTLLFFV